MTPLVVVLSSPSGGGKSSITRQVLPERARRGYSVSATTRPPRAGEKDGEAYYFLSPDGVRAAGSRRGVPRARDVQRASLRHAGERSAAGDPGWPARAARHRNRGCAAGARSASRMRVLVFVVPPSGAVLVERLRGRGTETAEVMAGRMQRRSTELAAALEYDYIVVNDDLERRCSVVNAILDAESAPDQPAARCGVPAGTDPERRSRPS